MLESAPKFQNLLERSQLILHVDNRDKGDVTSLQIIRVWIERSHGKYRRAVQSGKRQKGYFYKRTLLNRSVLRMVRVTPKRVSYANGVADSFKAEVRELRQFVNCPADGCLERVCKLSLLCHCERSKAIFIKKKEITSSSIASRNDRVCRFSDSS